jgi:hypothetical protein
MIDNYDDLTVDETLDAVSDFDESQQREFIEFEREHKDRTTVIDPLEAELESTDDSGGETPDDGSPTVIADPTEEVEVTKPVGYGYAAGLWFDNADESHTVERNSRIQRAIESGELEEVE